MESLRVRRIKVFSRHTQKSKYYTIMKTFYKIIQLTICLDFGFYEHKSWEKRVFLKLFTIIQCFFMCFVCLFCLHHRNSVVLIAWVSFYLFHYFLNALILVLFNPDKTFYKLHQDLESIDVMLRADNASYSLEKKILCVILVDFGLRAVLAVCYCVMSDLCLKPIISAVIYMAVFYSLDLVHITCGFVYYSVYCRLKSLKSVLMIANLDYPSLQFTYKSIVELIEMYKSTFDPLVSVSIDQAYLNSNLPTTKTKFCC